MAASPLFTGCATALVTPFLPGGTLDEAALRRLIARQSAAGMDALVLLGTTGEPCTLTMSERERVIEIGLDEAGSLPIIVGTGANDTRKSIEYARQALSLGATGQLSVTPYYNKATQTGLLRHYEAILDACPLPMILYNVPSRTGVCIKPETAVKLSRHSLIAGIKEASGDFTLIADLLVQPGMMPVYCGNDDLIWPMMAMGAIGAVSVVSNVAPQRTLAVTRAALAGHVSEAAAAQTDILPLIRALFAQVNPIPVKAALSMLGLCGDVLRLPLTPMEEPHREQLRALLSMQTFL